KRTRIDLENLPALLDRLVVLSRQIVNPAKMRTRHKLKRLEFFSTLGFGNRLVKTLDRNEVRAVPLVRRCISWFQLDRSLKLTFGLSPVPVPTKVDKRQRGVRFG